MQVTPEQTQECETVEDDQLTSAANNNAVPELTATTATNDVPGSAVTQDVEPAPMETATESASDAAQVSDHTTLACTELA